MSHQDDHVAQLAFELLRGRQACGGQQHKFAKPQPDHGPLRGRLDDRLAGEQVRVVGSFRPIGADDEFARWRHEVGTIAVTELLDHAPGSPLSRFANGIRRLLTEGAASLGRDDRAVFTGMVLGDDRAQSAVVADDFRAAGLGHLLVVSGQNVAFVIALLEPLTRRVRPAGRLAAVLVALLVFVTLTRFEASVLRACAMAGLSVGAAVLGGPIDGRRALSASVTLLLFLDPFLVRVLAFQLSVLATGGIVWLGAPLARRVPGPEILRVAIATTTAAQLAVSPLLIATFGPVPLAALPANLLAGPVSGPIMMWGCTGGVVAGVLGEPFAGWIHEPTGAMVGWVRGVAAAVATLPPVTIGGLGLAIIGLGLVAVVAGPPVPRGLAGVSIAMVALLAISSPSHPGVGRTELGAGAEIWVGDQTVLVLDDPRRPRVVLETLRRVGVRRIDLVVATDGDRADADVVVALRARFGDLAVVAPPLHRVPTATSVHPDSVVVVAGALVRPERDGDAVRLVVGPCPEPTCHTGGSEVIS